MARTTSPRDMPPNRLRVRLRVCTRAFPHQQHCETTQEGAAEPVTRGVIVGGGQVFGRERVADPGAGP